MTHRLRVEDAALDVAALDWAMLDGIIVDNSGD